MPLPPPNPALATHAPDPVPLLCLDPFFSFYSRGPLLAGDDVRSASGATRGMACLVRLDGVPYRLMGSRPGGLEALGQSTREVYPTRTIYTFAGHGVEIRICTTTPLLTHDLDLMARPVSYISWWARSLDGRPHDVSLYLDVTAEVPSGDAEQDVEWSHLKIEGLDAVALGAGARTLYMTSISGRLAIGSCEATRRAFAYGSYPLGDSRMPRRTHDELPAATCVLDLGMVTPQPVHRYVLLAMVDDTVGSFHEQTLVPYWRRDGMEVDEVIQEAIHLYGLNAHLCLTFDEKMVSELERSGGPEYAAMASLRYRRCLSAHRLLADERGNLVLERQGAADPPLASLDFLHTGAEFRQASILECAEGAKRRG